jgi:hypothetical protein
MDLSDTVAWPDRSRGTHIRGVRDEVRRADGGPPLGSTHGRVSLERASGRTLVPRRVASADRMPYVASYTSEQLLASGLGVVSGSEEFCRAWRRLSEAASFV